MLAQFQSPAFERVVRYLEANSTAYLVMEFESGEALSDVVRSRGAMPEEEVRPLAIALLRGLGAVH